MNTESAGKPNVLVLAKTNPILRVMKDDGKRKPAILKFTITSKELLTLLIKRWGNTWSSQNHISGRLLHFCTSLMLLA